MALSKHPVYCPPHTVKEICYTCACPRPSSRYTRSTANNRPSWLRLRQTVLNVSQMLDTYWHDGVADSSKAVGHTPRLRHP